MFVLKCTRINRFIVVVNISGPKTHLHTHTHRLFGVVYLAIAFVCEWDDGHNMHINRDNMRIYTYSFILLNCIRCSRPNLTKAAKDGNNSKLFSLKIAINPWQNGQTTVENTHYFHCVIESYLYHLLYESKLTIAETKECFNSTTQYSFSSVRAHSSIRTFEFV